MEIDSRLRSPLRSENHLQFWLLNIRTQVAGTNERVHGLQHTPIPITFSDSSGNLSRNGRPYYSITHHSQTRLFSSSNHNKNNKSTLKLHLLVSKSGPELKRSLPLERASRRYWQPQFDSKQSNNLARVEPYSYTSLLGLVVTSVSKDQLLAIARRVPR